MGTAFLPKRSQYTLLLFICSILGLGYPKVAQAQVIPDTTLGNEASVVLEDSVVRGAFADLIEGGAVRGSNVFHSFSDFNIGELQRVYFANPVGIENILSRVTGNNPSDLLGTLGVDGNANLFFLNPNGITFGPNSQLDITGSFFASTAEAFDFGNGLLYGVTDPSVPPLLAVTLAPGLQYGNNTPQGNIQSTGTLQVGESETLSLYGNDVIVTGELSSSGGTVQVLGNRVGLFESAVVNVSSADGGGAVYIGGAFRGDESLPGAQHTVIGPDVVISADGLQNGDGGEIVVWADDTTQAYGTFSAQGGQAAGDGGLIEVSGKLFLDFQGVANTQAPNGDFGTLLLDPTNIRIVSDAEAETADLALVSDATFPDIGGDGDTKLAVSAINGATSNVRLEAEEDISFETRIEIRTPSVGIAAIAGERISVVEPIVTLGGAITLTSQEIDISRTIASAGGNITISGEDFISINNAGAIESGDIFSGTNDAGEVNVNTAGTLSLTEGSQIRAGTFGVGDGGDIIVSASSILLSGRGFGEPSGILSLVSPGSSASGGNVTVVADNISLEDGATISTPNQGEGASGNLSVTANQLITLDGSGTSIGSTVFGSGSGGEVDIAANNISLTNGATIVNSNLGNGVADRLSVTAEQQIEVDGFASAGDIFLGASGIGSNVRSLGPGANVTVDAASILITNGAVISTSTFGSGASGSLAVEADKIEVDGFSSIGDVFQGASGISSDVGATGSGGDVTVDADNISITNGAVITTSNIGNGVAGSLLVEGEQIEIDGFTSIGDTFIGSGGIASNVFASGPGGNVTVYATNIAVTNGATISTSNRGDGVSGNLLVTTDRLDLSGFAEVDQRLFEFSSIGSQTFGSGTGGNVVVDASDISIIDGAVITNSNRGNGEVGNLLVSADQITIDGAATDDMNSSPSSINSEVFASGNGGNITVDSANISIINGANISTSNIGSGTAGSLSVIVDQLELEGFASDNDRLLGVSGISSTVLASGNGGDVTVDASNISIASGASISTSNSGEGNSGNITVIANNDIEIDGFVSIGGVFDGSSSIASIVEGSGDGGDITLEANNLAITGGASVSTSNTSEGLAGNLSVDANQIEVNGFASDGQTFGTSSSISSVVQSSGNGGDVTLEANNLAITDGASVSTSNFGEGSAGNLSVNANRIEVDGFASIDKVFLGVSGLGSQVNALGSGGDVAINTGSLVVTDGATLSTSTTGAGAAGKLRVLASQIDLDNFSSITSEAFSTGTGGEVTIGIPNTPITNIFVTNGARISTITSGLSDAADLRIQVIDEIELSNNSSISSASLTSANSGDVSLVAGNISLENGSGISAGTFANQAVPNASQATAGEVNLTADSILLDRSAVSTTGNLGDGGNLFVTADDFVLLRNGSQISTTAGLLTAGGDGGRITVNAPFVAGVLSENSDITANAFSGDGGTVTVTAFDIIGLEFQEQLTPFSDITASSTGGGNQGITEFNSLTNVDVQEGLNDLPASLVDPTSLIDQRCDLLAASSTNDVTNQFTVVGRGGLPTTPGETLNEEALIEDLGPSIENSIAYQDNDNAQTVISSNSDPIEVISEPQGWARTPEGRLVLYAAANSHNIPVQLDTTCASPPEQHRGANSL